MKHYVATHDIRAVVCGNEFAIAACKKGFYSWGSNEFGCLGCRPTCISIKGVNMLNSRPSDHYVIKPVYEFIGQSTFTTDFGDDVLFSEKVRIGPTYGPGYVQMHQNVLAVACGNNHVMLITAGDNSGCNSDFGCELYSWGRYTGLGLGAARELKRDRFAYCDKPHRVNISAPGAVSCGNDYSLILARGSVYLCSNGSVPELVCAGVARIFACCYGFAIWNKPTSDLGPTDDSAFGGRMFGSPHCTRDGRITHYNVGDGGSCSLYNRHMNYQWVLGDDIVHCKAETRMRADELRKLVCWPPAKCGTDTLLSIIDLRGVDPILDAVGDGGACALLLTRDCVYLRVGPNHTELICIW